MGIFSGGKTVQLDSVIYNMAGDETQRVSYIKSLVVRNILSRTKDSMAETFQKGYLHGPAIKFRSFYNWVGRNNNYNLVGYPTGNVRGIGSVPLNAVKAEIPPVTGKSIWMQKAQLDYVDYSVWAEQFMLENHPDLFGSNWVASINRATDQITITFEDASTQVFTPDNYDIHAQYIYAWYTLMDGDVVTPDPAKVFIYKIGSGNPDLDALVNSVQSYGQFFPVIPVRLFNNFVSETASGELYTQSKKAYKKALGADYDDLIVKISDNPDLDKIDHTYVVFGISVNTKEPAAMTYMYRFFEKLQASQSADATAYANWLNARQTQNNTQGNWATWYDGQSDPESPVYGTDQPDKPEFTNAPENVIFIGNGAEVTLSYVVAITWNYITNGEGTGLGKVGAKKGDIWWGSNPAINVGGIVWGGPTIGYSGGATRTPVRLYWQREDNSYTYLEIVGMTHYNFIYETNAILTTLERGAFDTDESSFILPLHYDTFREVSLVDSTQMTSSCCYLVFNCFKIYKQKWYQTTIFQILLFVAFVVIATLTGGAGIGLLGSSLAIGTALGFSGITAAIIGSVINALAALVLTTIIQIASTAIFGPEIGAIVAAVLSLLVMNFATSYWGSGGNLSFAWGDLLRVDNLIQLTSSVGDGLAQAINAGTMNIGEQMKDYAEKSKEDAEKIQQAFFEQFGYGAGQINPLMFVDSTKKILAESSSTFLTRTLMTGSDIAELSKDLLDNFTDYSLKLQDAFT